MKDNMSIFNEAFFKKASYEEKRAKRLPQYEPVDLKKSAGTKMGPTVSGPAYQVTDTDEVKRRLSGAFGVTFGNNSVRSMASRAIKEFPIVISDAVEPDTALMIKKLVEEQYAEYINLLISNQVVNLSDFQANDPEGNIAIQALDSISGSDFRRSRIADKAARGGNIDADTVFQNIPLYNLLRENQKELKTGDSITDALLENAIVIPSSEVQKLIEFYDFNADEIAELNEAIYPYDTAEMNNSAKERDEEAKNAKLRRYIMDDETYDDRSEEITRRDKTVDAKRGFHGVDDEGKEIYNRLTTGDIVLDKTRFDQAVNRSVGEMLTMPENVEIRDKFEKATFLLQSRRISGLEYYQYLTLRLGIPVSDAARLRLVKEYKIADIRKYGQGATEGEGKRGYVISKKEVKSVAENRKTTEGIISQILNTKVKKAIAIGAAAGAAAGIGAGIGAIAKAGGLAAAGSGIIAAMAASPILSGALIGCAVAGSAVLIRALVKKIKAKKEQSKIQGWERVERLIHEMDRQQEEVRKQLRSEGITTSRQIELAANQAMNRSEKIDNGNERLEKASKDLKGSSYTDKDGKTQERLGAKAQYLYDIEQTNKMIERNLRESAILTESEDIPYSFLEYHKVSGEAFGEIFFEAAAEIANEYKNDKYLMAEILAEKTIAKTTMPMTTKYVTKKEDKDLLVTPSFMTRDNYAYGSTEIDRKALKDRRYNQPLIMTIKFKERFNDEKYTDNELTAVIGILGRIIRVPSNEMEYVLSESVKGNTIDGFLGNPNALKDTIEDMFNTTKISKELKALPHSADIWRNLEKVTTLAAANKISGRRNGNISNAHIVFSQKEIDNVRTDTGVDFLKEVKKSIAFMKRYSAFTVMVANDAGQRMNILDDQDALSWNVVPYSALAGKDSGDQLSAALTKMMRL